MSALFDLRPAPALGQHFSSFDELTKIFYKTGPSVKSSATMYPSEIQQGGIYVRKVFKLPMESPSR
ncbi:hypothetical protein L873DRAFT_1820799 [Choiromyces venosus 120613-1]|uniref:Uncharacterized protein n=1 Tax=Choiromyces venosus 120613-1 TaxID=1336337 RepID=A0A3N4IXH0_9PEZI|nr:hypothetical protein L873DRAFT_1820799 [Choiromyces venosus 120613-1]